MMLGTSKFARKRRAAEAIAVLTGRAASPAKARVPRTDARMT
jgi:hypothetical protein